MLGGLIAQTEQELAYLESAADLLQRTTSQAEMDEIRLELEQQGICKKKGGAKGNKKPAPLPLLEYKTADGLRVLVGRSNLQNDRLSFKLAKGNDLWLHVQGYPCSHVVLEAAGQTPPNQSIEEAAVIAAWHSKAQGSSAGAGDYTPVKLLKKPNGAPPGKVIYPTYQTLIVTPRDPNQSNGGTHHGRN